MAIAYTRVTFPHLFPDAGAVALFAYLGRRNVRDPRTGRIYEFEKLRGDLVCEMVRLPGDSPPEFHDPIFLATEIDVAEMRRLRSLTDRQRWPQLGASFVLALPPDWELTLDGALELANRFVQLILAGRPIPTFAVVHDPNRVRSGDCNRHLHVEMGPRRIGPTGLYLRKERALLAQVRTGKEIYLAEKINWPTVYAELQNYLFAECGLDLAVDPPLPYGRRHWPRSVYRDEQDRVAEHDRMIDDQNFALVIGGHPSELVDRMRRGRSTVSVGEIRNLVARYGLTNDAVEERLDEILCDPDILTFARSQSETRPARVTIRALANLIERATTAIDIAALVPDPRGRSIQVVVGPDEQAVVLALNERLQLESVNRIIILGACLSDAEGLANAVTHPEALVLTTKDLINPTCKSSRSLPNGGLHRRDLLVAPRGEMIDDEALAHLLDLADRAGVRLIIGFATNCQRGVISSGLAAYAADRLGVSNSPSNSDSKRLLASGIIESPLRALYEMGRIIFEPFDHTPNENEVNRRLIVCNDHLRRATINHAAGGIRLATVDQCDASLMRGQWIVWERTDYNRAPPVSAGRLGKVYDRIDEENWLIELDGALNQFHWTELQSVRPTYAISIEEARRAPSSVELKIQLDDHKYAWASLLLAAAHGESAFVWVRPEIATTITQLIDITRRSLRGALPSHLVRRSDPNADVREILTAEAHELDCELTADLEQFPEPQGNQPADIAQTNSIFPRPNLDMSPARYPVHQDLWRIFSSTSVGREALGRLEQALSPEAPNRDAEAARLLAIAGQDTPIAHLIAAIYNEGIPARQDINGADLHEIPGPRAWTPLQLALARIEASTIPYSSQWNLAPVRGDAMTRAPK